MIRLRRATRQKWLLALVAACIATACVELMLRSGFTAGTENVYLDFWHRLAQVRYVPSHTALVMIDDPSLTARPDEPLAFWTPHFSRALATLREVGVCVWACPVNAIDFPECLGGEWYVSDTRHGPMVHARLIPGGENSGKLVSKVREVARTLAEERKADLVVVDGPPGVGCAVIASVSGASLVLVVTEPTLSGAHDMARVLELTRHFNIPTAVCVNKWDLNADMADRIESEARKSGAAIAGRVRYDRAVTAAQLRGLAVVETDAGPVGEDIRAVWEALH